MELKRNSAKSRRAAALRAELVSVLGGHCQSCSSTHKLEFHFHGFGGENHHFMPWPERIRWYWSRHLRGEVTLLCKLCHQKVTHTENRNSGFNRPFRPRSSLYVFDFEAYSVY